MPAWLASAVPSQSLTAGLRGLAQRFQCAGGAVAFVSESVLRLFENGLFFEQLIGGERVFYG
jgi:hypothetical protein